MSQSLRRYSVLFLFLLAFCGMRVFAQNSSGSRLLKTGDAIVSVGKTLTYTLKYENLGEASAQNVSIEDTIPAGVEFVPGSASDGGALSGNRIVFRFALIAAHASKTVSYRVQIPASMRKGTQISAGYALVSSNAGSGTSESVITTLVAPRAATAIGPGVIVFATRRDPATERQIYSIKPDGSGLTQLTNDDSIVHSQPALSADGSKIVFLGATRSTADPLVLNPPHLYVMNAQPQSATNQPVQLTNATAGNEPDASSTLCWSPNNVQVIYTVSSTFHLVADLTPQTSDHGAIFLGVFGGADFSFSPDGSQLAFSRNVDSTDHRISTLKLDLDSSGKVLGNSDSEVILLQDVLSKALPTWSPDGSKIAFAQANSTDSGAQNDLYVLNVASKAVTRLTTNQNVFGDGLGTTSWSPDGSLLTFGSDGLGRKPDGTLTTTGVDGVYTIRPVPTTDENGDNFPKYISPGNTGYYPHFAQVKSSVTFAGSLRKAAIATKDEFAPAISSVPQNGTFYYRIAFTLRNTSNSAVTGVTIKDQVPSGTTYVSGGDSTSTDSLGNKSVIFKIGAIAANSSVSGISIFGVKVDSSLPSGAKINNAASLYFAQSGGTKINGDNDVIVTVTNAPAGKLVLSNRLLQLNGKVVPANEGPVLAPGDELLYLLSFSNQTGSAITNLVATDEIPANTFSTKGAYFTDANGKAITTPAGYKYQIGGDPKKATYTIAKLDAGVTAYAILGVKVGDVENGTLIRNTVMLIADNVTRQTVNQENTVNAIPALSLVKSVISINATATTAGATVIPGDTIRYLFKYSNTGRRDATNVQITDPIPSNTRAVSVDFTDSKGVHVDASDGSTANLTAADGTITYKIPRLAVGATGYAALSVLVNNDAASKATQIANSNYSLSADGSISLKNLPTLTNPLHAPLSISKILSQVNGTTYNGTASVKSGDVLTYSLTVKNPSGTGAATANTITVTDFLPQDTIYKAGSGGTLSTATPSFVSFSIPTLAVGASKVLSFAVTVDNSIGTSVVNSNYGAQISGLNRRFTGTAVSTPVFQPAKLAVSKTATVIETGSTTQIAAGQNLRAVFTVTNTGGQALSNVRLNVPVSPELAFSQAFLGTVNAPVSGAKPILSGDGRTLSYQFGSLAVGASVSGTLEAQLRFQTTATSVVLGSDFADTPNPPSPSATDAAITLKVGGTKPPRPFPFFTVTATSDGDKEITQVSPDTQFTLVFNYVNAVQGGKGATLRGAVINTVLPTITRDGVSVLPRIVSSSVPFTRIGAAVNFDIGNIVADAPPGKIKLVLEIPATAEVGKTLEFPGYFNTINYGEVLKDSAPLKVVATPKIDLGVGIDGSVTASQPRTPDGRLKPGAVIDYQLIATNSGAGTASLVALKVPVPAGTTYVPNSDKVSATLGTVRSVGIGTNPDQTGKIVGLTFIPTEGLTTNATMVVSFSVRINSDAPQSLTQITNSATLQGIGPDGKTQTVTSSTDTQRVFIPAPSPARLALSVNRDRVGLRNVPFTTTFTISNTGGTAAKNVILRYSFTPEDEFFVSASDGGSPVGVSQLPRTIFWDGQGGPHAGQFASLAPHDFITVTLVTKPKNDGGLKALTGEIAEALEKNERGGTEQISNPVTRNLPGNYTIIGTFNPAARTTARVRTAAVAKTAAGANIFTAIGDLISSIGASIGNAIFGGSKNVDPALAKKLENYDPTKSRVVSNAGEDSLSLTLNDGRTVTIYPLIAGSSYRIVGPLGVVSNDGGSVISNDGGSVVSNDGGSLIATGGGNFKIKTDIGLRSISQIFSALISQDGAGLKGTLELYNGGSGTLISQDGAGLISQDGAGIIPLSSLISQDGAGLLASSKLISQDGAGFKLAVGASLISQDGAGLIAAGVGNLVAAGAGNLIATGGGNVYNYQGNDMHAQMASSLVAAGAGN